MDDLLGEFIAETAEGLSTLDAELMKLEHAPGDQPRLRSIFRIMHTIKGTSGFFELRRLEAIAHSSEDLLGKLRDGRLKPSKDAIDLVFKVVDRIRAILTAIETNCAEPAGDDSDLIATIRAYVETRQRAAIADPTEPFVFEADDPAQSFATSTSAPCGASTVRVQIDLLENLMRSVNELAATRDQLVKLQRCGGNAAFSRPLERLSFLTSELRYGMMRTRMQPIGTVWSKLPRLVHDLASDLGKKIDLVVSGDDIELERYTIDLIKDSLLHMVRNAADHGIEHPAARLSAGKPEIGTIGLNAYHEGGSTVIEISDDGRGLDTDRIKCKILDQHLATSSQIDEMTDEQSHQYIFRPGFTTASEITNISGRGVGMDVVLSNVEKIGGSLRLKTVTGKGSVITLKIPRSLEPVTLPLPRPASARIRAGTPRRIKVMG